MKLKSLSVFAVGLLAGALSAATVTTSATCSAEQVDGSTKTISDVDGCHLMDPETANVMASVVNTTGFLQLETTADSFMTASGYARSGEALAEISFTDLFATAGAPRLGLIQYQFIAVALGGDLTGRSTAHVGFDGSLVNFEISDGGFTDPITRKAESNGLVPFQLGRNIAMELTLEAFARTFFVDGNLNSLRESASIQISYEFQFFEADGETGVNVVAALPEVPEPQTYALARSRAILHPSYAAYWCGTRV